MILEGHTDSRYGRIFFTAEYAPPVNGGTAAAHLLYCGFAPWISPGTRLPRILRDHLEKQAATSAANLPEPKAQWCNSRTLHTPSETGPGSASESIAERIGEALDGAEGPPIRFYGSDFQKQVWRALLMIPRGHVCSYGDIAAAVGRPGAVRAVGSAVGSNPLAPLVPCHRVLPAGGGIGNYGGGSEKKRRLLELEKAPLFADRTDSRYFFFT